MRISTFDSKELQQISRLDTQYSIQITTSDGSCFKVVELDNGNLSIHVDDLLVVYPQATNAVQLCHQCYGKAERCLVRKHILRK